MLRVALCLMKRHACSLGGIGFYVASFVKAFHMKGMIVDIITDQPFSKDDVAFEELKRCKIIAPSNPVPYTTANKQFAFMKQYSPIELFLNSQRVIIEACHANIYSFIFINSIEMAPGIVHSGIQNIVPCLTYSHDGQLISDYPDSVNDFGALLHSAFTLPMVKQDDYDIPFVKETTAIEMPSLEEKEFRSIEADPLRPSRAMFIGTWRISKKPEDFVRFCKERNLPANVITSPDGVALFEKAFKEAGVEAVVKSNLSGEEKVRFIAEATVGFHPSEIECYSYAVIEMLRYMPVIVYDGIWQKRLFRFNNLIKVKNVKEAISFDYISVGDSKEVVLDYFDSNLQYVKWVDEYNLQSSKIGNQRSRSPYLPTVQGIISEKGGISVARFWTEVYSTSDANLAAIETIYKIARTVGYLNTEDSSFLGGFVQEDDGLSMFFQ